MRKTEFTVAVLAIFCLASALLSRVPSRSDVNTYDIWADVNNDGKIDMKDVGIVARLYGASGTNVTKASIGYDSGWINIADKQGENIIVVHNLNRTDFVIYITGKTALDDGAHQTLLGATGSIQGWSKTYGRIHTDEAYALLQTADKGYALAGRTLSFASSGYDFWLVKTDELGNMEWNKTYGGTGVDYARALVGTIDGGYALAGYTNSFGAGGHDFWLVKTDEQGNIEWNRTYGGINNDEAYALLQTSDNGYALAGYTNSLGNFTRDFWLVKTDEQGNIEWNRTYGGINNDEAYALLQTSDNGYALAGDSDSFGHGGYDFWLVKTDELGNMEWNKTYGGTGVDYARALVGTIDGGYALAGYTNSFGAGGTDAWLVKSDALGNLQWNKTYGGASFDYAQAMVKTADGGYALAGRTEAYFDNVSTRDYWLVKTDEQGNVELNRTYGGVYTDWAYALVETVDGGYALAGTTLSFGAGSNDFWLVKTNIEIGSAQGLSWVGSSVNSVNLYRGSKDSFWNYVRVVVWAPA